MANNYNQTKPSIKKSVGKETETGLSENENNTLPTL